MPRSRSVGPASGYPSTLRPDQSAFYYTEEVRPRFGSSSRGIEMNRLVDPNDPRRGRVHAEYDTYAIGGSRPIRSSESQRCRTGFPDRLFEPSSVGSDPGYGRDIYREAVGHYKQSHIDFPPKSRWKTEYDAYKGGESDIRQINRRLDRHEMDRREHPIQLAPGEVLVGKPKASREWHRTFSGMHREQCEAKSRVSERREKFGQDFIGYDSKRSYIGHVKQVTGYKKGAFTSDRVAKKHWDYGDP